MRVVVPEPEDLVGKLIDGRFEVLAKLGEGGMGSVYRANQASIGREVALKVIDRTLARDPASVQRFMREAKLASQLAHPNTVGVIEFGQDESGLVYLVMELVRGKTLYQLTKDTGAFAIDRIARIGGQLVDALEAAHALSIVHRDLKLENVMLLEGGRDLVKVLDFGLARSFSDPTSRATASGVIAGTPRYLAPEVLDGAEPAPAQDLYALGVLLAELAIGGSLWDAPTFESLFMVKLQGLPPKLDGVDPALRELVARLLAPSPSQRPAPAEIRTALVAIERGSHDAGTSRQALAHSPLALEPTGAFLSRPPPEVEPPARLLPDSAFQPPEAVAPPPKIEMDAAWQAEKNARIDASKAAPAKRSHAWWILTVIVIAALAGAGWWYAKHSAPAAKSPPHSL